MLYERELYYVYAFIIGWEMVYFNKKKYIHKFSRIACPNYNFNSTWTSDL